MIRLNCNNERKEWIPFGEDLLVFGEAFFLNFFATDLDWIKLYLGDPIGYMGVVFWYISAVIKNK